MAGKTVNQDEWDADYGRRQRAGQTAWGDYFRGASRTWPLTRYNAKAFDDSTTVHPIGKCPHCSGHGTVVLDIEKGS